MKNISVLVIAVMFVAIPEISFATCGCITRTREAIERKDSKGALENFEVSLNKEYSYMGGGYAGPTVFDLSEGEIRSAYKLIYQLSPTEFRNNSYSYVEGIKGLKTSRVINSDTYDASKTQLIFKLDAELYRRHEVYEYQEVLNQLNYQIGTPDGVIGQKTSNAIRSFQRTYNLSVTGSIDTGFKEKVKVVTQSEGRLRSINQENENLLLLKVEYPKNQKSQYIITSGNGTPIYKGDDYSKVVERINETIANNPTKEVYFDMEGFSSDKAKAFTTSVRIRQEQLNDSIHINAPFISIEAQDLYFAREFEIARTTSTIEQVQTGVFQGWYRATFDVFQRIGTSIQKGIFHVYSSSKEVLQAFIERVEYHLGLGGITSTSPQAIQNMNLATVVAKAKSEIKSKYNLTGFQVSEKSLEELKHQNIPDNVYSVLTTMKGKYFSTEREFIDALHIQIGSNQSEQYKTLILKNIKLREDDILRIELQDQIGNINLGWLNKGYEFSS